MHENCFYNSLFSGYTIKCVYILFIYANCFRDTLCLIEWKTSKSQKNELHSTYDNPLQVVAYAGAINWSGLYQKQVNIF